MIMAMAGMLMLPSFSPSLAGQPRPGDAVRVRLAEADQAWQTGTLTLLTDREIRLLTDGPVTYSLDGIARLQRRGRNTRGMLLGALVGAAGGAALGLWIPASEKVPDQDKPGYAIVATAGGAVLGAATGSGRTGRKSVLLGGAGGVVLGTVILGRACESDSPNWCALVIGGGFGAAFGTVIGGGIGLTLPNWIDVEGLGVRLSF